MAKSVFITKPDPEYDDLPEVRYHFPERYLSLAKASLGDWIVYYEPRRNSGRQAYFATARVARIETDPLRSDHYYAFVDSYLEFPRPVPFREGDFFYESALRKSDGTVNLGLFRWAIHQVPEQDYQLILAKGIADLPNLSEFEALELVHEETVDYDRPIVERLLARPYRDRAFSRVVRSAYDCTCAMTGLRLINGMGRPEVEAAHIRFVEAFGPDSPRNGIALCRTIHWLFDRGIVSLDDDGRILRAGSLLPESVEGMFRSEKYASLPQNHSLRPHKEFLRWHRENIYKG